MNKTTSKCQVCGKRYKLSIVAQGNPEDVRNKICFTCELILGFYNASIKTLSLKTNITESEVIKRLEMLNMIKI